MCRLLGIVASETADFSFCLNRAPRSLAAVSHEHPHGWGLAVHERGRGWEVHREVTCAGQDERFKTVASESRGKLLVAHVRKRTVGPLSVLNTHPFQEGRWIFAHNGTIEDTSYLEKHTAPERRRAIQGETDSERYFAYLLTAVEKAGGIEGARRAGDAVDRALVDAITRCTRRPRFGAANFLLSDGDVLYALRFGRTLHVLARGPGDAVRTTRTLGSTEVEVGTAWTSRREAFLVASERLSDEPWTEVAEGTLLRIDGGAHPRQTTLLQAA